MFRSLDGVPVAFKKAAVVELKTVLSNIANKKQPDTSDPKPETLTTASASLPQVRTFTSHQWDRGRWMFLFLLSSFSNTDPYIGTLNHNATSRLRQIIQTLNIFVKSAVSETWSPFGLLLQGGRTDEPPCVPSPVVAVGSPTPYTDLTGIQTRRSDGSVLRWVQCCRSVSFNTDPDPLTKFNNVFFKNIPFTVISVNDAHHVVWKHLGTYANQPKLCGSNWICN